MHRFFKVRAWPCSWDPDVGKGFIQETCEVTEKAHRDFNGQQSLSKRQQQRATEPLDSLCSLFVHLLQKHTRRQQTWVRVLAHTHVPRRDAVTEHQQTPVGINPSEDSFLPDSRPLTTVLAPCYGFALLEQTPIVPHVLLSIGSVQAFFFIFGARWSRTWQWIRNERRLLQKYDSPICYSN